MPEKTYTDRIKNTEDQVDGLLENMLVDAILREGARQIASGEHTQAEVVQIIKKNGVKNKILANLANRSQP